MTGAASRLLTNAATHHLLQLSFWIWFCEQLVVQLVCAHSLCFFISFCGLWIGSSLEAGTPLVVLRDLRDFFALGSCWILGPRALSTLGDCLSIITGSSFLIFSLDSLLQSLPDQLLSVLCNVSIAFIWASIALSLSPFNTDINCSMLLISLSYGVTIGVVILWCLNSTVSETLSALDSLVSTRWHL